MLSLAAFTCGKDPRAPAANEDQLIVVPGRVYGVVDGATAIGGGLYPGADGRPARGGRLAAEAVAAALATLGRETAEPPDPLAVVDAAQAAVTALYDRLGPDAPADPAHRFRASLAAAFETDVGLRIVALGDCGVRLGGRMLVGWRNETDRVLAALRAALWHRLRAAGQDAETAAARARTVIAMGCDADPPEGVMRSDRDAARAAVLARDDLGPADRLAAVMAAGLAGVRAEPARFGLQGIDGIGPVAAEAILTRDVPRAALDVLELYSDGYEAPPADTTLAAWEAAQAAVEAADPMRVGPHAGTKGSGQGRFADDRSLLIVRWKRRP